MLVTMTVALLDPYTLREPTPLESKSICVMSLKAAKARNGMGISQIFANLNIAQRLNYIGKVCLRKCLWQWWWLYSPWKPCVKQPQFTQKLFKFEYFFKAQLYCHSLFAEMFVTVMVALLALETLCEATPIETNSIYVALSVTQDSQGKGCHGHFQIFFLNLSTAQRLMYIDKVFSGDVCDDGGFTCPGHLAWGNTKRNWFNLCHVTHGSQDEECQGHLLKNLVTLSSA
jgi:hypothetical protein